jgi:PRMT5 TIM barrel domain
MIHPRNLTVNDEELKRNNELQFKQEMDFALHVAMNETVCIDLANNDPEALGKLVGDSWPGLFNFDATSRTVVEILMVNYSTNSKAHREDIPSDEEDDSDDPWIVWQKFYAATGFNKNVEVALVMPQHLPRKEIIRRWLGEQVAMLIIPTSCFISEKAKIPVLPKNHQTGRFYEKIFLSSFSLHNHFEIN